MGSDVVPMADAVYVGIATTSHSATTATDAVLDSFKVTAGSTPNQPPNVAVTSPANGSTFTVGNSVTVNAAANDADGTVTQVNFFAGTAQIGSSSTAPYSVTWSPAAAGTYSLTAVATDNDGASTTSAAVSVRLDPAANQPPSVSLTAPANGASYTAPASISLAATASDPENALARVEFYSGTTLLNSDTAAPYAFTWSSVPAGTYTLRAVAYDSAGASASSGTATVTVTAPANQPPTVSLTSPTNGATFTAPAALMLNATATDSDGTIARVEFYNGTTLLGSDTSAPFSYSWTNVAAGTYTIKAVAYDSANASASSATATITVQNASTDRAYGLDEGTGSSVNDSSGIGPAGTVSGATWTSGRYGQGLSFAGSGEVNFGDVDLSGAMTVMGWMQTRTLYSNTCGSFIMKVHDYGFEICNGRLYAGVGANNVWSARPSIVLSASDLNVWRHVAFAYDGAMVSLFVDGALIGTASAVHTTTDNPLILGHWLPSGENWDGLIDEVRLYNRALSQTEIQSAMNTQIGTGTTNQQPTVSLTSPTSGATFTAPANVTLSANATDSDGTIARVEFYNGTTLLNSDTAAPYSFTWSSVPAGTYAVKAVAYDNSGASTSSAAVTVTVSAAANTPPTVSLTSPTSGATFTAPATVTLSANATDSDGTIARVEFYNGTTLLNTDTAAPYSFTWSSVPAGTYAVKAVAYDNSGASASSATVTVTVSAAANKPPTVTLTSPTSGATFTAPANVTLSANATDSDGTIARVEFYNGATLLNSDTAAPYSFTWSSVPAGTYAVKAVAYDNSGASTTSAVSTITVSTSTTTPPTGVVFTASPDHATLVTSYELRIYASGADPNTATPVATSNLGKPTPDANNDITVSQPAFFSALAPGNYVAAVAAIGSGGSSLSTAVTFTR